MVTIRIKATGQIKEVMRNEAHALIDKHEAEIVVKPVPQRSFGYNTRQQHSKITK